ncbi:hypothetical protein R3I94_018249 [Phoxinus phoxinus]
MSQASTPMKWAGSGPTLCCCLGPDRVTRTPTRSGSGFEENKAGY